MKYKYCITVFTPTFNRQHTLKRLYKSLVNQEYENFEWLIVDDGSTDDTDQLVEKFQNEGKLKIKYLKKKNEGKHIAVKEGVKLAKGKYFFIVDSDDMLMKKALQTIQDYDEKYDDNSAGFYFRMIDYTNKKLIGDSFPNKEFVSNHVHKIYVLNIKGDLAEVIKTDVLKNIEIPKFDNEKFCAESLFLNRIAKSYNSWYIDKPIYIAQYLSDGLTSNSILNRRKSPLYASLIYKELAEFNCLSFFKKIRTYVNYWRFALFTQRGFVENFKFIDNNLLGLIGLFFALPIILRDSLILSRKLN